MKFHYSQLSLLAILAWGPVAPALQVLPDPPEPIPAAEAGAMEVELTGAAFQNALRHLLEGKVRRGTLGGFHLYDCPRDQRRSKGRETLCLLGEHDWVGVPADMSPDDFHGGLVFRDGVNYGWKSFFPSGYTPEQVQAYLLQVAAERLTWQPVPGSDTVVKGLLGDGSHGLPQGVLIYDTAGKVILTLYPDVPAAAVPPSAFDGLLHPHELRAPEAGHAAVDADTLLQVRQLLETLDRDGIEHLKAGNMAVPAALRHILRAAIAAGEAEQVELLLLCSGVVAKPTDFSEALRPWPEAKRKAQAAIVGSLLRSTSYVEQAFLFDALKTENPELVKTLVTWCLDNKRLLKEVRERQEAIGKLCSALIGRMQKDFKPLPESPDAPELTVPATSGSVSAHPAGSSAIGAMTAAEELEPTIVAVTTADEVELAIRAWIQEPAAPPSSWLTPSVSTGRASSSC